MIRRLIRAIVSPLAKHYYRWTSQGTRMNSDIEWIREWHQINPGKCMYCSYTNWANKGQGQRLIVEPHFCIENNGGPIDGLPQAKVIR